MSEGTLTIYSASAGSGKTHKLTGIYLEKLFRSGFNYRRILAVTFTNKATAEMKNRILEELSRLASGSDSKFLEDLLVATGKSEARLRSEAGEILHLILHDYSRFNVSTIDSFNQKIIRAFARDVGLNSGYKVEIDHSRILLEAIENVINSADHDPLVRNWLTMFARATIEDGKSWDIKRSIRGLSGELFNEKFRLLPEEAKKKTGDKELLVSYINELKALRSGFLKTMKELGSECRAYFDTFGLTDDMFFQKTKGVPGFVRAALGGAPRQPNSYVRAINDTPPKWTSGKLPPALESALNAGLEKTMKSMIQYYDDNIVLFNTAEQVLANIYILGILSDVINQVRLITKNENTFLLSDAGELIYLITREDQAPFIYERTGNTFNHFMIDEFQDTSVIQWESFRHLIWNSMSEGFDNLVVGDIKQSIYRWRNSDWHTLNSLKLSADGKRFLPIPLETNYRSFSNIIRFNNALFTVIPYLLDKEMENDRQPTCFRDLYAEAVQKDPGKKPGGYVRLEFIDDTDEMDWTEHVLQLLPGLIETIQDKGYKASDIGILVRDNTEGAVVLKTMIDYSMYCPPGKREKYNYNIVSSESLLLVNSPAIGFIIALIRIIDNPDDMISRAMMIRNYLLATGKYGAGEADISRENLEDTASRVFPAGYEDFINNTRYETLWDITEKTISFFGLGDYPGNVPYLNTFQDHVATHGMAGNPGLHSFLDWWDEEGMKKSVILPENLESIRVITIHKSKGLEFKVVIMPFISWNLDHKPLHTNILWVSPEVSPFNMLGIVPVRYKSDLENTIFAKDYHDEKVAAYIDNLNLMYVSFTRTVNIFIGFSPASSGASTRMAGLLREAVTYTGEFDGYPEAFLYNHFDESSGVFELGTLTGSEIGPVSGDAVSMLHYPVHDNSGSLKIKLHWEDYYQDDAAAEIREKVSYGKIMHEIFSGILTSEDVGRAIRKKVLEGKIPGYEEDALREKIESLLADPRVKGWFDKGLEIYNETSFLMPGSGMKRPDRIILRNGRVTIIDFKFGLESDTHVRQVSQYKYIIEKMGYPVDQAFLWYVDAGKIISV